MAVVSLKGRESEAGVLSLLAAAQIHRDAVDALARAPAIAADYETRQGLLLWGYEDAAEVRGIVGVEPGEDGSGVVRDLAVHPEHRDRGLGRSLLDFLRGEAGFTQLEGDTLASAAAFYKRCGFTVREDGTMPNGEVRFRFTWPH